MKLNNNNIKKIYNNEIINHDLNTLFIQDAITGTEYILKQIYRGRNTGFNTERTIYEKREKRIQNVNKCISDGFVTKRLLKEKGSYKLIKSVQRCNNRLCSNCNQIFQKRNRSVLRKVVKTYRECRFMTINFKNVEHLNKDYVKKCSRQFNLMKKYLNRFSIKKNLLKILKKLLDENHINQDRYDNLNKYYKSYKDKDRVFTLGNYINVMEIKYSKEKGWNLHYHILFEGSYIPVEVGREALKRASKSESYYVDIRYISEERVKNKVKAVNYITKYITKMNYHSEDLSLMMEFYKSTDRMRFIKIHNTNEEVKSIVAKGNAQFEDFFVYLVYNTDKEKIEIIAQIDMYMEQMEFWGMYNYNFRDSLEENVFKYANKDMMLLANGV